MVAGFAIVTRLYGLVEILQTPLDGFMGLANAWAVQTLQGLLPYRDYYLPYPPLVLALFIPVRLAALPLGSSPETFQLVFALMVLASDLLMTALVVALARALGLPAAGRLLAGITYLTSTALLGPINLYLRVDLPSAVCVILGMLWLIKGRPLWAFGALGVAVALKPHWVVLSPLWFIWLNKRRRGVSKAGEYPALQDAKNRPPHPKRAVGRRGFIKDGSALLLALLLPLVTLLPFLVLAPGALSDNVGVQLTRGVEVESTPAFVLRVLGALGGPRPAHYPSPRSITDELQAPLASPVALAGSLASAGALVALFLWTARRPFTSARELVGACALALLLLLLFYRVFQPQYLAWVLPLLAVLVPLRRRPAVGFALTTGLALLSGLFYPRHWAGLVAQNLTTLALLGVRLAVLLVLAGVVWWLVKESDKRQSFSPSPAPWLGLAGLAGGFLALSVLMREWDLTGSAEWLWLGLGATLAALLAPRQEKRAARS